MNDDFDELNIDSVASVCLLRKSVYIFLDYIFRKDPDSEIMEKLRALLPKLEVYVQSSASDEFSSALSSAVLFLRDDSHLEELEMEYARVFYSVDRNNGVFPYESVYLSPERLVMQEPRDEVVEFYAGNKMAVDRSSFKEPEDHISAELSFMASVYSYAAEGALNDDVLKLLTNLEQGLEFLHKHLLRWVDKFYDDVKSSGCHELYRLVALMTVSFIREDRAFLDQFTSMLKEGAK